MKKIPDPVKSEEQPESFIKRKGKKIAKYQKLQKTKKQTSNGDLNYITVRHSKTASNLLKPVTQLKRFQKCFVQ